MGVSFFQTAPHTHFLRYAILLNFLAFILIIFAFGFSWQFNSSAVHISTDFFDTETGEDGATVVASVSPTTIRLKNKVTVCPFDDVDAATRGQISDWTSCEVFTDSGKIALGFDGVVLAAILIVYCVSRGLTTWIADERTLIGTFFGLQLIPLTLHILARLAFEARAARAAVSFLRDNALAPAISTLADDDLGFFYGPTQAIHATVAACLGGALALIACKLFQISAQARIDAVELNRECSARLRADNPGKYPPLRWMLDPRFHPIFDADELEAARELIAKAGDAGHPEVAELKQQLENAEREWGVQQEEMEREALAFEEYSHRIRRDERVNDRAVVDDWERQQTIWEQRKEKIAAEFKKMDEDPDYVAASAVEESSSSPAASPNKTAAAIAKLPPRAPPGTPPDSKSKPEEEPEAPSAAAE